MTSDNSEPLFCLPCSQSAFNIWKGWPPVGTENWSKKDKRKTILPSLPTIQNGRCASCNSTETLNIDQLYFQNIHGPGNTGLPDYFVIKISDDSEGELVERLRKKWGIPYAGQTKATP